MGDVIEFPKNKVLFLPRKKTPYQQYIPDPEDMTKRIQRIRESLERINILMNQIKEIHLGKKTIEGSIEGSNQNPPSI